LTSNSCGQGADPNTTVTPLAQSLSFASGELTTSVRFAAADGAWSLELEVLQLVSQATPSVALQRLTLRQRSPPGLNVTIAPALSTFGTPVTPCCSG